jgi:polysaccharide transporter, PST family
MINKIKKKLKSKNNKQLLSNFISLFTLQGLNYILPLITVPYLIRVLGVETFGLLAFATAFVMYFQVITNYGFQLTATREISIHRDNRKKVIEIFSSVMIIKSLLLIFSFILLSILVFSIDSLRNEFLVYFLTFGTVIGQVLFPVWFFQGMEKMKYITYLNIVSKSIFTAAIFIFVHDQSDYLLVPLFTSVGFIVAGVLSLRVVKIEFNVEFRFQSIQTIKNYLVDGWHIFAGNAYTSVYLTANVLILGIFTNNTIVGYYSIAEKIAAAFSGLFIPLNQALYPYLTNIYSHSIKKFKNLVYKIMLTFFILSFIITISAYFFKENIIYIISGENYHLVELIFTILLVRILTSPFSSLFTNILNIMKRNREYLKVMNYTVALHVIFVMPSIYIYGAVGLAYGFVLLGIIHTALLYAKVRK